MVLSYFTIQDKIVQNVLNTISCTNNPDKLKSPIVVGGMAVQLHTMDMSDYGILRPTCDLDVLYIPEIESYVEFEKGIGGTMSKSLKNEGYQVQLKKIKDRPQFEVKIMLGQGQKAQELFFIHFDKRTEELTNRTKYISERECNNAIEHPYNGSCVYLTRLEDILPHKIKRVRKGVNSGVNLSYLEQALYKNAEQGQWSSLAYNTQLLNDWLEHVLTLQNELQLSEKHTPSREYVIAKDLYDICLLARKIEGISGSFNRAYYLNSKKEIDSI